MCLMRLFAVLGLTHKTHLCSAQWPWRHAELGSEPVEPSATGGQRTSTRAAQDAMCVDVERRAE